MPNEFEQSGDQEPGFLRNYMYMYADAGITGSSATLSFQHIPATFRFKITNKRPSTATINSVEVTVVDADGVKQSVASKVVDVHVEADKDPELRYHLTSNSQDTPYKEVTTKINTELTSNEMFTAYALVLPLDGDDPLKGKKIRFTINASNPANEYLSFELDAYDLAGVHTNNEYNWIGGKSYTIRMSLSDVLTSPEGAETAVYGLAPGTQYTINLQIGQDIVTLGNITAAAWGTPIEGGELETE